MDQGEVFRAQVVNVSEQFRLRMVLIEDRVGQVRRLSLEMLRKGVVISFCTLHIA
jgi:hypothetical protein